MTGNPKRETGKVLLEVKDLHATVEGREILKGVDLTVNSGEVHAIMEHEASTSKIGEDQIFYLRQRGLSSEDAVSMIVNGFCKEVFKELPMEFAVEATRLLGISLDGSVG